MCCIYLYMFPLIWTMMISMFQLLISSLSVLQFAGVIDIIGHDAFTIYIKILYFVNAERGTTRIPIGPVVPEISDAASIFVYRTPETAKRVFITSITLVLTNMIWMYASMCMLLKERRYKNTLAFYIWASFTTLNIFMDLVICTMFLNDVKYTSTLVDLIKYINATSAGLGAHNPSTRWASYGMAILQSKGILSILLTFATVFIVALCNYGDSDTTENDVENIEMGPIEIPRPDMDAQIRKPPEPPNPQNRQPPSLPDVPEIQDYRAPPSPPPNIIVNDESETSNGEPGKAVVKFPPSLLSIPQRLENMMSKNVLLTRPIIHTISTNQAFSELQTKLERSDRVSPVASTSKDFGDNVVDTHGRRGTAIELQSQLPWTYMPHSVNRVEDKEQQTENEVPPPVPVPDYTVHPTYRKASVHRTDEWKEHWRRKKSFIGHENIDAYGEVDENEQIVKIIRHRVNAIKENAPQKKDVSATRAVDRTDELKEHWRRKKSFIGHENIDAYGEVDEDEPIVKIIRHRVNVVKENVPQKKYASATRDMDILY